MLSCYVQMVKYWHRIKTDTPDTSVINKILSYMEEKEDPGEHYSLSNNQPWDMEIYPTPR